MTAQEVLTRLSTLGSEKSLQTYMKQGVGEHQFGVGRTKIRKLAKKVKQKTMDRCLVEIATHFPAYTERCIAIGKLDEMVVLFQKVVHQNMHPNGLWRFRIEGNRGLCSEDALNFSNHHFFNHTILGHCTA